MVFSSRKGRLWSHFFERFLLTVKYLEVTEKPLIENSGTSSFNWGKEGILGIFFPNQNQEFGVYGILASQERHFPI